VLPAVTTKHWKSVTAGERLFQRIWAVIGGLPAAAWFRSAEDSLDFSYRGIQFGRTIEEIVTTNLNARLIEAARYYRTDPQFQSASESEIVRYIKEWLPTYWSIPLAEHGELAALAYLAADSATDSLETKLRRAILRKIDALGGLKCYLCGRALNLEERFDESPYFPTLDHLWPRRWGGDTDEANLLPACPRCNHGKDHLKSWCWLPVFSAYSPLKATEAQIQTIFNEPVRLARYLSHVRSHAIKKRMTLRESALEIGPMKSPQLTDEMDACDFFCVSVVGPRVLGGFDGFRLSMPDI